MPECGDIVAVDAAPNAIGFNFADHREIVPPGNDHAYIDRIKRSVQAIPRPCYFALFR